METTYIIVACYPDKGMKSCGSKGLLNFADRRLMDYQIDWLAKTSSSNIVIIADFDYMKIQKHYHQYNTINANGKNPVRIACENYPDRNLCFVDYGCIFGKENLRKFTFLTSEIMCIKNPQKNNNLDVGCTIHNGYIEHMFFDLPSNKFCNIFSITAQDSKKIVDSIDFHNHNLLYFEILNLLIYHHSVIKPVYIEKDFIYFNNMRQKNAINKFIKKIRS